MHPASSMSNSREPPFLAAAGVAAAGAAVADAVAAVGATAFATGPSVVSLFLMMSWCSLLADRVASGWRLPQALLAVKTPGFATRAEHAASRIYSAVAAGRAEITITPEAWLIALTAALLPESTQFAAGLVNCFMLPASPNTRHPDEFD